MSYYNPHKNRRRMGASAIYAYTDYHTPAERNDENEQTVEKEDKSISTLKLPELKIKELISKEIQASDPPKQLKLSLKNTNKRIDIKDPSYWWPKIHQTMSRNKTPSRLSNKTYSVQMKQDKNADIMIYDLVNRKIME